MEGIVSAHGRAISSIDIGTRVVLRGDIDSPIMTCVAPIIPQGSNPPTPVAWVCAWFNAVYAPGPDGEVVCCGKLLQQGQFLTEVLERATEAQ